MSRNPTAASTQAARSDAVLARRFLKERGARFRYLRGTWLACADGRWYVDREFAVQRAMRACVAGIWTEVRDLPLRSAERKALTKLATICNEPERQRGALVAASALLRVGDEAVDPLRCEALSRQIETHATFDTSTISDKEALAWLIAAGHVGRVRGTRGLVEHLSSFTAEVRSAHESRAIHLTPAGREERAS